MVGRIWKLGSIAAAVLVLAAVPATALAASHRALGAAVANAELESSVLNNVNALRRSHGLAALRPSAALAAAAQQHSDSMALQGYFSHDSADGGAFWQRLQHFYPSAPFDYWSVGENLLWSSPDVDGSGALQMWMDSPPHRENLLAPGWREIGISAVHIDSAAGVYGDQPVTIVTADFGVRH